MWKFYLVTAVYLGNMLVRRVGPDVPTFASETAMETVRAVRGPRGRAARAEGCGWLRRVRISSSYV